MPSRWKFCVKIHENCGGVCRWVEAVERRGVGWTGECIVCGEENIPCEQMIPLRAFDHEEILQVDPGDLRDLEWDKGTDWDANQDRLTSEVDSLVG